MGSPELIIPVRMDVGKAILQLQHIDGTDRKVGDEVTKETAKGKQGLMRFEDGSANTSKSLLELPRVQLGTSSIRVAAGTVGEEFKRAGAYVKHIANEFTELRKHMHDVMTLKGSADCNEVAVEGCKRHRHSTSCRENTGLSSQKLRITREARSGARTRMSLWPRARITAGLLLS